MALLTIILVAAAVAGSLAFNRRVWRRGQSSARISPDGPNLAELCVPIASLAALLLVFVLVQVFSSWSAAGRAETTEATASLLLFRQAELLPDPAVRARTRRDVICYTTSVIKQEWPALARGRLSSVPTYWSGLVRDGGERLARSERHADQGQELIDRDGDRARARQDRLGEAQPSIPTALFLLMLVTVVITLGLLGAFNARPVSPRAHLVVVVLSGLAFGGTLLLIRGLDHPYSGLTGRDPAQTILVRGLMRREVRGPLPCDARGLPTHVANFRATTSPLP